MSPRASAPHQQILEGVRLTAAAQASPRADQVTYVVVEPAPQERTGSKEQRGGQRQRTRLRSGKVADRRNHFVIECLFHDRSTGGARLRLVENVPLPSPLMVYDDETGALASARVVWRKHQDVGIRFDARERAAGARDGASLGRKFYAL